MLALDSPQAFNGLDLWMLDPIPASGMNGAGFHPAWLVKTAKDDESANVVVQRRELKIKVEFVSRSLWFRSLLIP